MLPGINLKFENGNLPTLLPSQDGVFGLLSSAVAVGTFALATPYQIKGMKDVAALGILPDIDNYVLHKALKEFYEEAGDGTELWLMGFPKTDKVSDWFTPDAITGKTPSEKLLDAANGKISLVFTKFSPTAAYTLTIDNGIDADVFLAKQKAQVLAKAYTANKYAPFLVILEGYGFNGNPIDLADLAEGSDNRVGVFLGSTEKRTATPPSIGTANHVMAGRLSKIQVHENAGKVKLRELETLTAFILDTVVENFDVESLHDKGYMTFRKHVRKAGYYISDDPLATALDDDYHYITRRRVIDKVFAIAHIIASNEVLNEFNLTAQGTIDPFYAKSVETAVERAIFEKMTAKGELAIDLSNKNDLGVKANFNLANNVANTNRVEMIIKVRPKGYARWFQVDLGYAVDLNIQQ